MIHNGFLEFFVGNSKHSLKISRKTRTTCETIRDIYYYTGQCKNDKANGNGILYFHGSVLYDGLWKDGQFMKGTVFGIGPLRGTVTYSGSFKNNVKHGKKVTDFCRNGNFKYKGEYKKGNRDGHGKLYDCETNELLYKGSFKNGLRQGKGIEYFDGIKQYEGGFKNDIYHGKGKEFCANGSYYIGTYKNGKREKIFRVFTHDGRLSRIYRYKDGILNGIGETFHSNGKLSSKIQYKNGYKNGNGKEYYQNGNILYDGQYKNDERNGRGKKFNINGELKEFGMFQHGVLRRGTLFIGRKKIVGNFLYGEKNGFCSIYNSDNKLECKGYFKEDMKDGIVSLYYSNGKLQFKGSFSEDIKHGQGKEYNENGQLIRSGLWKNNIFEGSKRDLKKKVEANIAENKIKIFMQTNEKSHLDKVKPNDIIAYLKKTSKKDVKGTKPKLIKELQKWRRQLKQIPVIQTGQQMVYNVYVMENTPIDEFLEEDNAIVLINEQGKHFSHVLPQHEIMYECENDRSYISYIGNPNVKAMIRLTTEGGNYYFLRSDSIVEDMKKGYNVFHFTTLPEDVRVLSKNVALGGDIISGAHCDPKDLVKVSKITKKEKRGNGLKMTVTIEF